MHEYRLYFIDQAGHISRPPEIVACTDNAEATQKAKQLIDGHDAARHGSGRDGRQRG
jgi:hypothetical protein